MITQENAEIAAMFWRGFLEQTNLISQDARMEDKHAMFMDIMQMMIASKTPPRTQEQLNEFEEELAKLIVERQPDDICVDYNPDKILRDAFEAAGLGEITMGTFPAKHRMYFDESNGRITVICGYAAPEIPIEDYFQ